MPKRKRSIYRKITDVRGEKPWLKRANNSSYKIESVETNKIVLIVCEGQTEKLYFESFPVLGLTVKAVNLQGQTKSRLIESTIEIIKNEGDFIYDEVWCIFDMDVKHGEKEFADYDNAILKAKSYKYKVAYSNDAFELWFYLHYYHTEQRNHRTFYYQCLSKEWGINYEKEGKRWDFCYKIYTLLENSQKASQENAIKRAKKLYNNQSGLKYHKQNPVTMVFQLVDFLNQNRRN